MVKSLTICLFLLAVTGRLGSMAESGLLAGSAKDPGDTFWSWFVKNEASLRHFQSDPDKYLREILVEVRKVQPGLVVELEPPGRNGVINLTVSADGNQALFPAVQSLVRKAPLIPGWKIIAFRQRASLSKVKMMTLKRDSFELDPDKMKFYPYIEGDSLDVVVYTEGVTADSYEEIGYFGLIIVGRILGEYDFVTKVRSYDFQDMPAFKEERDSLRPLLSLAGYVDRYYAGKNVKKRE